MAAVGCFILGGQPRPCCGGSRPRKGCCGRARCASLAPARGRYASAALVAAYAQMPELFVEMMLLDFNQAALIVEKRNETLTAVQALALLNNRFMVRMAEHFPERAAKAGHALEVQVSEAWRLALGRSPTAES